MIVQIPHRDTFLLADLSQPIDISMPLREGADTVNCFYAPPFEAAPVVMGSFIGSTAQGGVVNFLNVKLNPHGNGTHTECVGHIAREPFTINQSLRQFHFLAKLISVYPAREDKGDRVIQRAQLEGWLEPGEAQAALIRTLPNDPGKLHRHYSGTNPPYLSHEAIEYLVECGVRHLLVDLPSVDREEDGGKLLGHRAFWQYPGTVEAGRADCTITELIFVPDEVPDGFYLLNIQIASFEIDASPSKPVLYPLRPAAAM
jgi:arylformamidase